MHYSEAQRIYNLSIVEPGVESPVSAHVSSHGYQCNILFALLKGFIALI